MNYCVGSVFILTLFSQLFYFLYSEGNLIMDYKDYIESNANVMLGKPIVKGTRITVALILKKLSEGATPEELIEAYPNLTFASISAVLAYASDIVSNETIIPAA